MWVFGLNGLLYAAYNLTSGEWRYVVPTRRSLAGAWQVVLRDLGLRRAPCPAASSTTPSVWPARASC